jgi:hypothetical protein
MKITTAAKATRTHINQPPLIKRSKKPIDKVSGAVVVCSAISARASESIGASVSSAARSAGVAVRMLIIIFEMFLVFNI